MRHGLLQASFIPALEQRDLRDLTRYHTRLVQERRREVNRVQGVLERANIKLAAVATDIMGVSARALVAALVEGRADPATMAELAKRRMRSKIPLLERALTELGRDHHLSRLPAGTPILGQHRCPQAAPDHVAETGRSLERPPARSRTSR